jgi:hypothetical protein
LFATVPTGVRVAMRRNPIAALAHRVIVNVPETPREHATFRDRGVAKDAFQEESKVTEHRTFLVARREREGRCFPFAGKRISHNPS